MVTYENLTAANALQLINNNICPNCDGKGYVHIYAETHHYSSAAKGTKKCNCDNGYRKPMHVVILVKESE